MQKNVPASKSLKQNVNPRPTSKRWVPWALLRKSNHSLTTSSHWIIWEKGLHSINGTFSLCQALGLAHLMFTTTPCRAHYNPQLTVRRVYVREGRWLAQATQLSRGRCMTTQMCMILDPMVHFWHSSLGSNGSLSWKELTSGSWIGTRAGVVLTSGL